MKNLQKNCIKKLKKIKFCVLKNFILFLLFYNFDSFKKNDVTFVNPLFI